MKTLKRVKSFEVQSADAVLRLLRRIPSLEIIPSPRGRDSQYHLRADERKDFRHGGRSYALIIEVKSYGAPRYARAAALQLKGLLAHLRETALNPDPQRLIPMFVANYLSPEARDICKSHDVAYLDLYDNAHLKFDDVYIDWATADRPKSEARALRSIFKPKAAAILRSLLGRPDRAWRVGELAEESNASLGHVSNVRKALLEREWIEKTDDGVVLVQPDSLLEAWRENYRRPTSLTVSGYTHFHGEQLDELLSKHLRKHGQGGRAICARNSAARWFAPYGRGSGLTLYADEAGLQRLKRALMLSPVEKGPNVTLVEMEDETLFEDAAEPSPGIFCTDHITTYLDLWNGNDRDREAAEFLAEELFSWL